MKRITPSQKLSILKSFKSFDYQNILKFFDLYKKDEIILKEFSGKKNFSKENILDLDNWITFNNQISAEFYQENKNIFVKITRGILNEKTWVATFQIKANHLKPFKAKMDFEIGKLGESLFGKKEEEIEKSKIQFNMKNWTDFVS